MSSPVTEEELGEKGHGGGRDLAGTMVAAAASEENSVEANVPAGSTCCICMETWTCNDAHHICCIPCGHVYGRSCLERWLHHCNESSAKCPQCGEPFALAHIINLYGPLNLWDGCCPIQELQADRDSNFAKLEARLHEQEQRIAQFESKIPDDSKLLVFSHGVENAATRIRIEFMSMKAQMEKLIEENATPMDLIGFMDGNCTKLWDWIPSMRSS